MHRCRAHNELTLLPDTPRAVGAFLEDSVTTGVDGDQTDDIVRDSGAVYMFDVAPTEAP